MKYTFGVAPLQQYLIEFPDGRLQALSIAWDARPKNEGGQRWFHLYPNERIAHKDELHWTRPAQNWNFMCADCHSTDVRKNYDSATDKFQTRWAEINVGCEACHGPGSRHVEWAGLQLPPLQKGGKGGFKSESEIPLNPPFSKGEESSKGLSARLDERRGVTWTQTRQAAMRCAPGRAQRSARSRYARNVMRGAARSPKATRPANRFSITIVPPCSRARSIMPTDNSATKFTTGAHSCRARCTPMASRAATATIPTAASCAPKATVCATCHLTGKYDTATHHHHKPASAGASCVGCHMPTTTYMVVDPRHDHSLRVPRPDLSLSLATPNACNELSHQSRRALGGGASETMVRPRAAGLSTLRRRFCRGQCGRGRCSGATACDRRRRQPSSHRPGNSASSAQCVRANARLKTRRTPRDSNPLLRLAALQSLANAPFAARVSLVAPLLSDPLKAMRIEAASLLAPVPPDQLNAEQRARV